MLDLTHLSGSETSMPPQTKKQRIISDILEKIQTGQYPPGSKLPSGRELREIYKASPTTVTSAIEWLKAKEYVLGVAGSGVYVVDQLPT